MLAIVATIWLFSLAISYVEGFSCVFISKASRRGALHPSQQECPQELRRKFLGRQMSTERSKTQLQLDVFGLGPYEVLMVGAVGVFLYGPDKLRQQLQKQKGVDGVAEVSNSLLPTSGDPAIVERIQRISDMRRIAKARRRDRALAMIQEAIERNDAEVIRKMEEYEGVFGIDVDGEYDDDDDIEDSQNDDIKTESAVESAVTKGF